MALNLPRLPQTEPTYAQWQVWWQQVAEAIELQESRQDDAFAALEAAVAAIAAAQAAADAAQVAADAADTAAAAADAAASAAQDTATAITESSALQSSYIVGAPALSGTDAGADVTIAIGAHTRRYPQPDGSNVDVSVNAGNLTGRAYSTLYYIYYDDAARAGGAVAYQSTTSQTTAAQTGVRHFVGQVLTPAAAAGPTGGNIIGPPGPGQVAL